MCTSLFASQVLPSGGTSGPGVDIMLGIEDRAHCGQWWAGVVRRYSAAELTFSKDRLVELSGIAWRMERRYGGKYVARIWQDTEFEAEMC
jgi:hypothetical protein